MNKYNQEDIEKIITLAKRRGLSNEQDYTTIAALNNILLKGEGTITAIFNHDLTLYNEFVGTYVVRDYSTMKEWIGANGRFHPQSELEELGRTSAETPRVAAIIEREGINWGIDFNYQSVMPMESTASQDGIATAEMMVGKPWNDIKQDIEHKTEILKSAIMAYDRLTEHRNIPSSNLSIS